MNQEKELLLALLIEKYTTKTLPTAEKVVKQSKRQRRTRGENHIWTNAEKQHLIKARAEGYSFSVIATMLKLRVAQCENMHYALTQRNKVAI